MLIKNDKLLKQSEFKLEKDIQTFVENHPEMHSRL